MSTDLALFAAMVWTLPPGTPEHARWLWVLMIVGGHFVPMGIRFGRSRCSAGRASPTPRAA